MTKKQHLFVCLAEECSEVQKEVMKILRFGLVKRGDKPHVSLRGNEIPPNHESLTAEIIDLLAVIQMLSDAGVIDLVKTGSKMNDKMIKVKKYMEYAHELGQLEIK